MKKLGYIIRWIIGCGIILIGLAVVGESVMTTVLWAAAGIVSLPPVSGKIPMFKGRKPVLIVGCVALLFAGVMAFPTTESTTPQPQPTQTASEEASQADEPSSEVEQIKPASLDADAADELRRWIGQSVSATTGTVSAEKADILKWSAFSEQEVLSVWQSVVLEQVHLTEETISYADGGQEETAYQDLTSYIRGAVELYGRLYSDSAEAEEVGKLAEELSKGVTANKELQKRYPFDLPTDYPSYSTFYITQRLENSYTDNILGMLQKEYDSYQAESTSNWVAYDVKYVFNTPLPGDTFRVIHADTLNPFTQTGVYDICYVDTGTTTETVDQKGFRKTVPVYQLVADLDEIDADRLTYTDNRNQYLACITELKRSLGEKEAAPAGDAGLYDGGEESGEVEQTDEATDFWEETADLETPTSAVGIPYSEFNLEMYEGYYMDAQESISVTLEVQPNESEFSCELFWFYGQMMENGIVAPGVPTRLSEGTMITLDLETNGGIHVVLEGTGNDPFHYEEYMTK